VQEAEGAKLGVLLQDSIEIGMLSLNRAKAPLNDVKVRQALNYAIDRQGIVDGLFFGLGKPAVQIYVGGLPGYSKDVPADTYAYNADKARSLLAEAGHADGFDVVVNVAAIDFVIAYAEAIKFGVHPGPCLDTDVAVAGIGRREVLVGGGPGGGLAEHEPVAVTAGASHRPVGPR
jgi:ABC-type transport system substrate-binding protein